MTTYSFKAHALTPIHVGCGREIDPTEFVLKGEKLVQVNPARLIAGLPPAERDRFTGFLDRADLKEMQNFLRHHTDESRDGVSRIDTCRLFRNEYEAKASNPNNQFRVDMMPRNPHTGQAYIPGSGIKGAIRTAVVNYLVNHDPTAVGPEGRRAIQAVDVKRRGQELEEKALNRSLRETQRDIFRLVHVEDCALPDNSTRVDRAASFNPFKPGSEKIQIWVERLISAADTHRPLEFDVVVRIDTQAMANPSVKGTLGRTLDLDRMLEACNQFYWGRMVAEGDRFDDRAQDGPSWQSIHGVFPRGQMEEGGEVFTIDPTNPFWHIPDAGRKRMLLRIGRFSHFESLSVDGLRCGWNAQSRKPIEDMGATRTRCVMENGKPLMPFGWMLLTLDSEEGITAY
jgi:CRISPR-associated protein Csm5